MKKEKVKEIAKKYLIGFILGVVSAYTISVIAVTYFPSNDVTYDNSESGLTSTNVQGAIDELYGVCTAEPPAGDQIIEDAGLEKDPYECRYFFTGANPNNYITFNDEEAGWRIVSVECDGTIKIMRKESIGIIAWDTSGDYGSNNWVRPATLNTYLNSTYYSGLNSTAQSQIVSKDFSIGAVAYNDTSLSNSINNENSKKWNGKVALTTASEYIRSNSNQGSCGNMNQLWNSLSCGNTTWMHNSTDWWTLSPFSGGSDYVFTVRSSSNFNGNNVTESSLVRPAVYLSAEVQITEGNGSKSNPYTIS